jgi:hypothetical protein
MARRRSTGSLLAHIGKLIAEHVRLGLAQAEEPAFRGARGLKQAVAAFERAFIHRAIVEHGGDRRKAAAALRIGFSTLKHKLNGAEERMRRNGTPGGANKGLRADMRCRIDGCARRSRGPRFGWICDRHASLPESAKRLARERWNARHRTFG